MKITALLIACLCFSFYGVSQDSAVTKIYAGSLNAVKANNLKFCDTLSVEIRGLYPVMKSMIPADADSTMVKSLLLDQGFKVVDLGWGNWMHGPRMIYTAYSKDKCRCETYKIWTDYLKMRNGYYSMKLSERIICHPVK